MNEAFVERRLANAASRALGPHRATVDEVSVLPLRFGLSVDSLRLEPEAGHRGRGIDLLVPEATLTGIRPWSLLGGPLEAGELTLTGPIEGVEVRGGRLDSLTFSVRVDRGRARGRAVPHYRGLSLSLEDPSSGRRGVMEWARGLLVDLELNADNLPSEGEGFRSATIDLRAEPGTTLWEYLRDCLSQGLKRVTGT